MSNPYIKQLENYWKNLVRTSGIFIYLLLSLSSARAFPVPDNYCAFTEYVILRAQQDDPRNVPPHVVEFLEKQAKRGNFQAAAYISITQPRDAEPQRLSLEEYRSTDQESKLIDVNRASVEELTKLPGIGPKTANRIVDLRKLMGKFKFPEDLLLVQGIGDKKFQKIRDRVIIR